METWNEALERYGKMYDKTLKFWKPCEKGEKMTNKYMKGHLIDYTCVRCKHYKTSAEEVPCSYCSNNYQSQYEEAPQTKEFTQDQLNKVFRDKFMERRAIGILEIEELIGELFR